MGWGWHRAQIQGMVLVASWTWGQPHRQAAAWRQGKESVDLGSLQFGDFLSFCAKNFLFGVTVSEVNGFLSYLVPFL